MGGITYTVTEIADFAFKNNENLTGDLTIADSVTKIGEEAFSGCTNLTAHINISSNITEIKKDSFYMSGITGLTIAPEGNELVLGDRAFAVTQIAGELIVPGRIKVITGSSFGLTKITSLVIQEGVQTIGGSAFDYNTELSGNIIIPRSVTTIDDYAFHNNQVENYYFLNETTVPTINIMAFNANTYSDFFIPETASPAIIQEYKDALIAAGIDINRIVPFNPADLSNPEITSFKINGREQDIIVDEQILFFLEPSLDVTQMNVEIGFNGQSISPESGIVQDFSEIVTYTVTSLDGSTKEYEVFVYSIPDITSQPVNAYAVYGGYAYFEVEAEGNPLSYQWQKSNNGGVSWDSIDVNDNATAKNARFEIENVSEDGLYRCLVSNGIATFETDEVTLTLGNATGVDREGDSFEKLFGYEEFSTEEFVFTGTTPITVSKAFGDEKISWNDVTQKVDIEAGLIPGEHVAEFKVVNGFGEPAEFYVSVNVSPNIQGNLYNVLENFPEFNGSGNLTARVDAPFDEFHSLKINGVEVDPINYEITSGSTVITLKESFLKTLENGEHEVLAAFFDGRAELKLNVNSIENDEANQSDKVGENASTGDNNNLWILVGVGITSVIIAGSLIILKKKKANN